MFIIANDAGSGPTSRTCFRSTAGNGVWVLPGSHKLGKVDIRKLVADSGSERIDGAVPLMVSDVTTAGELRGYADFDAAKQAIAEARAV